jgi:hypothetical protein
MLKICKIVKTGKGSAKHRMSLQSMDRAMHKGCNPSYFDGNLKFTFVVTVCIDSIITLCWFQQIAQVTTLSSFVKKKKTIINAF